MEESDKDAPSLTPCDVPVWILCPRGCVWGAHQVSWPFDKPTLHITWNAHLSNYIRYLACFTNKHHWKSIFTMLRLSLQWDQCGPFLPRHRGSVWDTGPPAVPSSLQTRLYHDRQQGLCQVHAGTSKFNSWKQLSQFRLRCHVFLIIWRFFLYFTRKLTPLNWITWISGLLLSFPI